MLAGAASSFEFLFGRSADPRDTLRRKSHQNSFRVREGTCAELVFQMAAVAEKDRGNSFFKALQLRKSPCLVFQGDGTTWPVIGEDDC